MSTPNPDPDDHTAWAAPGSPPPQPAPAAPHPGGGPYGQQPYPNAAVGYGQPIATAPGPTPGSGGQPTCRVCGAYPAVNTTIRRHQGLILIMRFTYVKGPFCRTCGTAIVRDMTTATLWQGWWSPFSLVLINPITIIINLIARAKLKNLPTPAPGQPRQQLVPGPPVFRRPIAYAVVLPVIWWIGLIVQLVRHS